MNRWGAVAALLVLAGALTLRLPQLDTRPLHNDEAVNAVKVTELWQHGRYAYDPDEYHGPTLHYFSLPFLWASPAGHPHDLPDATLRLAPVAFGTGLIVLLLLFTDGLGRRAAAWAAVFTAVSPAMVFYSRYFIHEMLLVFFTALTLGAGWRYHQTHLARWAVMTGAGVGLMWATKETFVLAGAAMALALVATLVKPATHWSRATGISADAVRANRATLIRHGALALGALGAVWLVLFTSFFQNWRGLPDSMLTYIPWLQRAGGDSPHNHPWYFYLERLAWFRPARSPVWSEGLILGLATVGLGVSLWRSPTPLHRFLAVYTVALLGIYSVISYKTPWCLLGFYHGMILLAGVGAAKLLEQVRPWTLKLAAGVVLAALTAQLTWQAVRANYVIEREHHRADEEEVRRPAAARSRLAFPSDPRNPYVYAQTVPDLRRLVSTAEGLARVAADGHDTVVKVIAPDSDYWPLPWSLRRFNYVGWYDTRPADPFAPIVIAGSRLNLRLDDQSERKWIMAGLFELRPTVFLELYVELELWKQYVAALPRAVD